MISITFRPVILAALVLAAVPVARAVAADQPLQFTVTAGESECRAEVYQVGDRVQRIQGLGSTLFVTSSLPSIVDDRRASGSYACSAFGAGEARGSSFGPPSQVTAGGVDLEAHITGSASAYGSSAGYADLTVGTKTSVEVFNPNDFDVELLVTTYGSRYGAMSNVNLGFYAVGGQGANTELTTHNEVGPEGCRSHRLLVTRLWPDMPGPDPLLDSPVDGPVQMTDSVLSPSDPSCLAQRQQNVVPAGGSLSLSSICGLNVGLDKDARTTVSFDSDGNPIYRSGYALGSYYARCSVAQQPITRAGAATLEVTVHSPVDLVVTDAGGRRTGFDLSRKQPIAEIPGALYTGHATEPQTVAIPFPAGDYDIQLTGIGDGPYTLTIRTLDIDGNELDRRETTGTITSGDQQMAQAHVNAAGTLGTAPPSDTTAPVTTASASPGPNAGGWNNTDVVVNLAAADETGGSGVKEIVYSLSGAQGGGGTVAGNTAPVPISAEGTTVLTYFARDNAGNAEAARTLTVRIDKTPPAVTCTTPPPTFTFGQIGASITATVADSGSGPAVSPVSAAAATSAVGAFTASVVGADVAGNQASASCAYAVVKAAQTIAFGTLPGRTEGEAPFTVGATASSGLPVSFGIVSGPATITGNTLTLLDSGTVVVRASQAGNANYSAAVPVDQSFVVAPGPAGQMGGAGEITQGDRRHHFEFVVWQAAGGREGGRLEYHVAMPGRGENHFHSTAVTRVTFSKGSATTAVFAGVGRWNGHDGYTFEAQATDAGRGGHGDTFTLTIRAGDGTTVATVSGPLSGGNIVASRARR